MDKTPSTQYCLTCRAHRTFNVLGEGGDYGCVICGWQRQTQLADAARGTLPFSVVVRVAENEIVRCPVWAINADDAGAIVADFFVRTHGWDWRNAQEAIERVTPKVGMVRGGR